MSAPEAPTLSVIIANYNYEKFVGAAIESVLAQKEDVQIIVVDDASTDNSVDVIKQYADRVETILLKENRGQGGGLNTGFEAATGTLVMFLDADDFLLPDGAATILANYRPEIAIYHYRMNYGDEDGGTFGVYPPMDQPLAGGNVSERLRTTGHYDGTVTSGLVFSREAVANVMPMDEETYNYGADGYLCSTVPLYGESVTISTPVSAYRLHTRQHSQFSKVYAERARWRLKHTKDRHNSTRMHAERLGLAVNPNLFEDDDFALQERVVSMIIEPEKHPIEGDTLRELLARSKARKLAQAGAVKKVWEYLWWTTLQIAPRGLQIAMIKPAIDADARPRWFQAMGRFAMRLVRR
ncbi:MAG: glycosyltransferase family 2 protein [Henriciella sp.]|nr:glycosyltransferase family 2 protein [Henriciella sp.]